jgi:hypothetical protein
MNEIVKVIGFDCSILESDCESLMANRIIDKITLDDLFGPDLEVEIERIRRVVEEIANRPWPLSPEDIEALEQANARGEEIARLSVERHENYRHRFWVAFFINDPAKG